MEVEYSRRVEYARGVMQQQSKLHSVAELSFCPVVQRITRHASIAKRNDCYMNRIRDV